MNPHRKLAAPRNAPPPHDPAAEAGALGCVMSADGDAGRLLDSLSENMFFDERNLEAFRGLLELQLDGRPLTAIELCQRRRDSGQKDTEGEVYIAALPDKTPSPLNFPYFLDVLLDRARRREMLLEAKQLQARAEDLSVSCNPASPAKGGLPDIESAAVLAADETAETPPEVVQGVLHRGCKMVIGSGSKARKTWILVDLAVSVATGSPWWKWPTTRGAVLYINFEIPRPFLRARINAVSAAKGIEDLTDLYVWNLRGHAARFDRLLPEMNERIAKDHYALIIIDPIYKGLGGRDENAAGDVAELCNELERLAVRTGAAVVFAAHYSKGNQAAKEAMDRIGGSGVFARDPDSIVTLTKHETEGALTVDLTLRNHPEQPPFVVCWDYPLMTEADGLNPDDLKKATGRSRDYSEDDAWKTLKDKGPFTAGEWQSQCEDDHGMSRRTFYTLKKTLEGAGRVFESKINGKWEATNKRQTR